MPRSPLLDSDALQRAELLDVQARGIVEGYMAGMHRSPLRGHAPEFTQHRAYVPGDDPRHLDWKVFARKDRYYIKQYEPQTNCVAHLLVDGSESMNYGSGAVTKLNYARTMAACLAYLILLQRDAVELEVFDAKLRERPPRADSPAQIHDLCAALLALQPKDATAISTALEKVAVQLKRRSLVILISDLLDDEEKILHSIRRLRFDRHEVVILHVLDPAELDFPFRNTVEFHGLETQGRLTARTPEIRDAYLAEFGAFLDRIRRGCEEQGCQYLRVRTDQKWADVLTAFLSTRLHRYG